MVQRSGTVLFLSDSNGIVNPQSLSWWMNTQQFSQTGQVIELCCEYLSLRYI